jgi:hypothetical protein
LLNMNERAKAWSVFLRWMIGKPRILNSAVWTGLGFLWLLAAAFEGPTNDRFVIGVLWLAVGVPQLALALSDRKNKRRFYQSSTPAHSPDPSTVSEPVEREK